MMNNVMVDLETLDNAPTSAILSIGAAVFDHTGVADGFYVNIKPQTCVDAGLTIGADTIIWWMDQSAEARASFKNKDALPLRTALLNLSSWMTSMDADTVWGNGATFDNVILANAYKAAGLVQPWKFWNDRCYRTMKNLYPWVKFTKPEVAHNALSDARAQAQHASDILAQIQGATYGG